MTTVRAKIGVSLFLRRDEEKRFFRYLPLLERTFAHPMSRKQYALDTTYSNKRSGMSEPLAGITLKPALNR